MTTPHNARLTPEEIQCLCTAPGDYCTTSHSVGVCSVGGKLACATLEKFNELAPDLREKILQDTFRDMRNLVKGVPNTGATASLVIAWQDGKKHQTEILIGHLGNCPVYAVSADTASPATLLNNLHTLDSPTERARLKDSHVSLPAGQTMTRAFGDTIAEQYGLIHTPEINHHTIPFDTSRSVIIVTASDKLTTVSAENIADIVRDTLYKAAQQFDRVAFNLVSAVASDVISVAVFPATNVVTSALVLESHGGPQVAAQIYNEFYRNLTGHLKSTIEEAQHTKFFHPHSSPKS
jgi:hypothetical protein